MCIQRQDLFAGLVLNAAAVKPVIMGSVLSSVAVRQFHVSPYLSQTIYIL